MCCQATCSARPRMAVATTSGRCSKCRTMGTEELDREGLPASTITAPTGRVPKAGLISDAAGRAFYGTTSAGGNSAAGSVFEISPNGSGVLADRKAVLCQIASAKAWTGSVPRAALVSGRQWKSVWHHVRKAAFLIELARPSSCRQTGSGGWTERGPAYLWRSCGRKRLTPAGLIFDGGGQSLRHHVIWGRQLLRNRVRIVAQWRRGLDGNGAVQFRRGHGRSCSPGWSDPGWRGQSLRHHVLWGAYNQGTVFELTPNGSGGWVETVLYSFNNSMAWTEPILTLVLIFDSAGNLCGTTFYGGTHNTGNRCLSCHAQREWRP